MAKDEKKDEKKLSDAEGYALAQERRKTTHQTKPGGKVVEWKGYFLQWTILVVSAGRICILSAKRINGSLTSVRPAVTANTIILDGMKG